MMIREGREEDDSSVMGAGELTGMNAKDFARIGATAGKNEAILVSEDTGYKVERSHGR